MFIKFVPAARELGREEWFNHVVVMPLQSAPPALNNKEASAPSSIVTTFLEWHAGVVTVRLAALCLLKR
jgi:hypothetical protein